MDSEQKRVFAERGTLGSLVVTIEFILISIVQGAAVATLAGTASTLVSLDTLLYIPYVITGFLFVLFFWSEAIGHTVSFIDWPLSLPHTFLYFAVGFFEVILFSNITNPYLWFSCMMVMSVLGLLLYVVDLGIIKQQRVEIASTPKGAILYAELLAEQKQGLFLKVPGAIAFNVLALVLLYLYPAFFIDAGYHVFLALLQAVFTAIVLFESVKNFTRRSDLIADVYGSAADQLPEAE